MQILGYFLSIFIFGLAEAKLYGSLLPELTALLKGSTWKPQLNALFVGRDESELGKLLGTKKDLNIAPRQLSSIVRPEPFLKGKTNGGTGLWKDGNRYQSNYWGQTGGSGGHIKSLGGIGKRKKRSLPKSWDWRDNTKCQSLNDIRYQECGDCWAVTSTSVMSDRYCLFTNQNKFFSARQVTTCVYPKEGGCDGGWPKDAMELYKSKGIASGGDPTIKDEPKGCLPYPYQLTSKSACPTSCDSKAALDVTKAGDYYEISSKNVNEIMQEIYDYGPVVSVMEIFDDFGYMGKGIYQHVSGKSKGFHSVRIVGYGEESGVPYWTVANSWGKDWGDMGYFKILRGKNHCGIESWITAVYPAESYKKAG